MKMKLLQIFLRINTQKELFEKKGCGNGGSEKVIILGLFMDYVVSPSINHKYLFISYNVWNRYFANQSKGRSYGFYI